jgi:hypothetical protein
MSSSGVIYAIIVGAWAVYLVPMWLRREDELNRARETQRYAAAIKVLAHKEAFERRVALAAGAEEALAPPLRRAAGQDFGPVDNTPWRPAATGSATSASTSGTSSVISAGVSAGTAQPSSARRTAATVATSASTSSSRATVSARTAPRRPSAQAPALTQAQTQAQSRLKSPGPRTGLMARRRRVVGALFAASTFGALVSADLGAGYLWTMALPAVLLSAYIVRLHRDERLRAAARAHRRILAQQSREAELRARKEADAARLAGELARAEAEAQTEAEYQAELQLRAQTARRRTAAARSRAQLYVQEAPELPRASNG